MNNLVEIKYSKSEKYPCIYINGDQISRYMDLSDYIYDDIFSWADRMYQSMDDELGEAYRVEIVGHPFHYEVLKATQKLSEFCSGIRFVPLDYKIPLSEKFEYVLKLNEQYSAVKKPEFACAAFECADAEHFNALNVKGAIFGETLCNYHITCGEPAPSAGVKICVVVGNEIKFFKQKGISYVYITEELLPMLVDYLNDYHIRIDFINAAFAAIGEKMTDETAKLEFDAFSKEEYRVWISSTPEKLDSGTSAEIEIKVFPKGFADPGIVLTSDNTNAIVCSGNKISALNAGTSIIRVCDASGKEYHSFKVTSEVHNYVSSIAVILPSTEINIDESMLIKSIITPADAEDASLVRYSVNRENVAAVNQHGELYGLSAGRVCVTVSTPRVSTKVYVSVLPKAYGVALPCEELELPYNAVATIPFSVVPANASPMPSASWSVTNKSVVKIISSGKSGCKIKSCGFGEAVLICTLGDTGIKKGMRIKVGKK